MAESNFDNFLRLLVPTEEPGSEEEINSEVLSMEDRVELVFRAFHQGNDVSLTEAERIAIRDKIFEVMVMEVDRQLLAKKLTSKIRTLNSQIIQTDDEVQASGNNGIKTRKENIVDEARLADFGAAAASDEPTPSSKWTQKLEINGRLYTAALLGKEVLLCGYFEKEWTRLIIDSQSFQLLEHDDESFRRCARLSRARLERALDEGLVLRFSI